jgi:exonuclease III
VIRQNPTRLKIFSTNGAGVVGGKLKSLQAAVLNTNANLVTLQETHSKRKGKIQLVDHVTFEAIRKAKGGGTLISAHKDLNPKLIVQYEEEFELLVVEIELKEKKVRVISGYGPQENWPEDKRMPFFIALETEIEKAALADRSVIIEMDANAKLGEKYIKGDPYEISPNGTILAQIVERQKLIVGNGVSICRGTITRQRVTRNRTEQSVIDVVLFSADMYDSLMSIEVDEARKYVLTKVVNTKKGPKVQESDHNPIVTEFKLQLKPSEKEDKLELYNLKNRECQIKFIQGIHN